jgi:hypothetical protein
MDWTCIPAYVTGTVDQELLARNEYLAAENRIMKVQLNGRLKLSNVERGVLGEIGHRLGRKVLADVTIRVAIAGLKAPNIELVHDCFGLTLIKAHRTVLTSLSALACAI